MAKADPTPGYRINPFTGKEEPKKPITLAPSPTDQRILAAPPHTEPLADLCEKVVNARGDGDVDVTEHEGPSLQEDPLPGVTPLPYMPDRETPKEDLTVVEEGNQGDNPPNDALLDDPDVETRVAEGPYRGQDTSEYVESLEEREAAKEAGDVDLPEVVKPEVQTQEGYTDDVNAVVPDEAPSQPAPEQPQEGDLHDQTVAELREQAAELDVEGRSSMNKDELVDAIEEKQGEEG